MTPFRKFVTIAVFLFTASACFQDADAGCHLRGRLFRGGFCHRKVERVRVVHRHHRQAAPCWVKPAKIEPVPACKCCKDCKCAGTQGGQCPATPTK
jgi:hypothetical protein